MYTVGHSSHKILHCISILFGICLRKARTLSTPVLSLLGTTDKFYLREEVPLVQFCLMSKKGR